MSRIHRYATEEEHFVTVAKNRPAILGPISTEAEPAPWKAKAAELRAEAAAERAARFPAGAPPSPAPLKRSLNPNISASLDELENTVEARRALTPSQLVLFAKHKPERELALRAMLHAGESDAVVGDFVQCGRFTHVHWSASRRSWKVVGNSCRNRLCPRCAAARRSHYAEKLAAAIGEARPRQWRFITLTLRSSEKPLGDQLTHLLTSFRRLRQQTLWKRGVIRCKAIVEVTWSEERQQWHPHLHILAEGRYLDQAKLSLAWEQASDGSPVCDIRALNNTTAAVRYTCKYLGKAPDLEAATDRVELLSAYYSAVKGRKLIIHCGKWPPIDEDPAAEKDDGGEDDWVDLGSLDDLMKRAMAGDLQAQEIIRAIVRDQAKAESFFDDVETNPD